MSIATFPDSWQIPPALTEVPAALFHAYLGVLIADASALGLIHEPSFLFMIVMTLISQKRSVALHSFYFESQLLETSNQGLCTSLRFSLLNSRLDCAISRFRIVFKQAQYSKRKGYLSWARSLALFLFK